MDFINMSILNSWLNRSFFIKAGLFYLSLLIILGLAQYENLPSAPILFLQIFYVFLAMFFSQIYSSASISRTLNCIFLFQLICGLGLRYFNYDYFDNPFGSEAIDAVKYDSFGKTMLLGYYKNFSSLLVKHIDDYGFPMIIYLVYNFFGNYGREILVVLNAGIITWSSFFLYKTSSLFVDCQKSTFLSFFWGIEAFAVCTAANGLKENFFVFFMIAAMFYLCRIYIRLSVKHIILFFIFALGTLFFRLAIYYAFMLTFVLILFLKSKFVKAYIWLFVLLFLFIAILSANSIIGTILEQRGFSYETINNQQAIKGGGLFAWVTNFVAVLVGPFPSFVADVGKRNYITLWSFTPFCKMLYSLFFLYGTYYALKKKKVEYFPFISMWAINSLMIFVTFFALHDRFQWPHIPYTLILSCLGYEALNKSKYNYFIKNGYLILVMVMIMFYNFRI